MKSDTITRQRRIDPRLTTGSVGAANPNSTYHAVGVEEIIHSMTTPLNRWSHGPSTTAHNRGARREEVSR